MKPDEKEGDDVPFDQMFKGDGRQLVLRGQPRSLAQQSAIKKHEPRRAMSSDIAEIGGPVKFARDRGFGRAMDWELGVEGKGGFTDAERQVCLVQRSSGAFHVYR